MSKLYSSREIIKVLTRQDFDFVSQKGSHAKYVRRSTEEAIVVIVPVRKKEIPRGTFRSILRQSHLRIEDFEKS